MTPVDTLGEPVTVVDALGEPVVLINNDGTPAFLAYSAKTYLGGVAPYHWLDFINNRALYAGADVGNVTQATGYSFTRASDGYYQNSDGTLTLFGSGALRRGDRGVLIEGARTNLLLQSQTFDNASWTKSATTITADATTAPDGTTTADKLVEGSGGSFHTMSQNATAGAAAAFTFTIFAKASERTFLYMQMDAGAAMPADRFAYFNLGTGAIGTTQANTTALIQALANGWYRCSITATADADGGGVTCKLITAQNGSTINYSGDGTSGIFIWGAQAENAASFPSSYIPTTTASATRAADVLTYTAGVSYPLSLWAEFERAVDTGGFETYFNIDDGSTANRADIYVDTSDLATFRVTAATTQQAGPTVAGSIAVGTVEKVAGRVATNSVNVARNSTLGTEDTSVTLPATPTRITIGLSAGAGAPPFGYIRRVAIIQGAGTDAQLQSMTSG
jgi:hypothetical protein